MKSVRSKTFADSRHSLYQETNPGGEKDRWHVDGVDWSRDTHSCTCGDYIFRIESHVLRCVAGAGPQWVLLVVVERWWGADRANIVHHIEWRRVVRGRDRDVLAWLARQRERFGDARVGALSQR